MTLNWSRLDRTYVVAELGMNHDGSLARAKALMRAAAESGADAVKLQTHIAEAETLRDAPMPPYFKAEPRWDYFKRTAFSRRQYGELKALARRLAVGFISSPFSEEAVDLLEEIGVDALKVPSGEVTNIPMLRRIARSGLPVLLSSGMSSWNELDLAVRTLRRGRGPLAVLQCTSRYPCPYESVGLNLIAQMEKRYHCPIGLSDHTTTLYASFAAVALGARVLERHFTLSKKAYGPDARFSLEPREFAELVRGVRAMDAMRSHPVDKDALCRRLADMKRVFEKSLVTTRPLRRGERFAPDSVAVKKPGGGLPPKDLARVLAARAAKDIPADTLIRPDMVRS